MLAFDIEKRGELCGTVLLRRPQGDKFENSLWGFYNKHSCISTLVLAFAPTISGEPFAVVSYLRRSGQRRNAIPDATAPPVQRHLFLEAGLHLGGLHLDAHRLSGLHKENGNVQRLDRFLDAGLQIWCECPNVFALDCLRLRAVCCLHCQHLLVEGDNDSGNERGVPMLHGIHLLSPVHSNCPANRADASRHV